MSINRMAEEDVIYICICISISIYLSIYLYNRILCSHQKKGNPVICNDVDGTRWYYAEWNKSIRERQLSYDIPDMRNLRDNLGVWGVGEEKMKQDGIGREMNHKRLLTSHKKLRVAGGLGEE